MSTKFLKVKIKSLAAESRIIKLEEQKLKRPKLVVWMDRGALGDTKHRTYTHTPTSEEKLAKWKKRAAASKARSTKTLTEFQLHRTRRVREESRATFIAYAYLRGKRYSDTETITLKDNAVIGPPESTLRLAVSMITRFGSDTNEVLNIQDWIQGDHAQTPK